MKNLLKQIREAQSVEDLEKIIDASCEYDISYRGGTLGFRGSDIASIVDTLVEYLPNKFGAHCNYLGGGLRGSIIASVGQYNENVPKSKAKILDEFAIACKRVYENIEADNGLIDEEDEDGETNWENLGTNKCRVAGIKSAY